MDQGYIDKIFGENGLIAQCHEGYEYREGQLEMARKVTAAFENKST